MRNKKNELNICEYSYGEYEDSPQIFVRLEMSKVQFFDLIYYIDISYGDTDQDTEEYCFETFIVIRSLLEGYMVLNPKYLYILHCFQGFKEIMTEEQWKKYEEAFERYGVAGDFCCREYVVIVPRRHCSVDSCTIYENYV